MSIIIFPPTIDWSWMKQRPQHLMSQLAKRGHSVFFCNKTQTQQALQQIEPNLFLVHNHLDFTDNLLPDLRKTYQHPVGIWCTLTNHVSLLRSYSADWIVYDCVDDFAEWLGYEKEMVRCSTWIVCTSQRLYERLRGTYPNSHIELIRNAYDDGMNLHLPEENTESLHESALSPEKKWVGYIGAWAPWVDELLVKKLSRLPEVEMVVVGPEYGKKYDSLNTSHNIHFLGLKPHHQLPSYIRRLSVCIIPFLLTPVTLATNPVKAYEYLAAGKSVVSTNMPECCLMSPHVDTVTNHEQFIETVSFRLNNPGDCSARTAFALEQTWGHRGEQIHKLISSGSSS